MIFSKTDEYVYFVSYNHGLGFGSSEVFLRRPITTWQDIESVTRLLTERAIRCGAINPHVVLLNYQLMRGPEARCHSHELDAKEK